MQKIYQRINWENDPSTNTPINEDNLNKMDYALYKLDDRVVNLYGYEERAKTSEENAGDSASNAAQSEINAFQYSKYSLNSANEAENSANKSLEYSNAAASSAVSAEQSNQESKQNADESSISAEQAGQSEANAFLYAESAKNDADQINGRIDDAESAAQSAEQSYQNVAEKSAVADEKAELAGQHALMAESYTHGGTGLRENEAVDNAQYYYQQTKQISQGMNGIVNMGTVTFENIPTTDIVLNAMYNISNAFTSDNRFTDGGGIYYGPGNNVVWTAEGKWDVTASSCVTGIKGAKETTYRQGNVNLTPEDVGAVATGGDISENTVTYTEIKTLEELTPGEKLSVAFGKIKLAVKNVINIMKLLGNTDISKINDGTVTGILSELNTNFNNLNSDLVPTRKSGCTTVNTAILESENVVANAYEVYIHVTIDKPYGNYTGLVKVPDGLFPKVSQKLNCTVKGSNNEYKAIIESNGVISIRDNESNIIIPELLDIDIWGTYYLL